MQRAAIFVLLAAPALASICPAGGKHKADLTGLTCNTASNDASSCGACCVENEASCGGLVSKDPATNKCSTDTYHSITDVWANAPATSATFQEKCCTKKATCGAAGYTCPAGFKKVTGAAKLAVECAGDAASCAVGATCCEADDTTCGSNADVKNTDACGGAGQYNIAKTAALQDNAWKATKIADKTKPALRMAACCGTQPTCKGFSCPATQKLKASPETISCTLPAKDCDATTCCDAMTDVCGVGAAPACISSHYYPGTDTWKNKYATAATKNTACCTTKATCAVAVCAAGTKKKANIDNLSCTGGKDTCQSTCCEANPLTCGGLTGISCPYGFYDASALWDSKTSQATKDAWNNRPATAATKNTACCTAKAICVDEGTTTPAPVAATTTPAAPVRLYSNHKVATQQGSQGANMVWLGLGAAIGMAALMIVQGIRSKMQESEE